MEKCAVYVIRAEGGFVKIGVSANPEQRLAELQTSHPRELLIEYLRWGKERREAFAVEKICHRQLEQYRATGEWFDVATDIAISTVKDVDLTQHPDIYGVVEVKYKPDPDWDEVKRLYIDGVSLRDLAKLLCAGGANFRTIGKRAKRENWRSKDTPNKKPKSRIIVKSRDTAIEADVTYEVISSHAKSRSDEVVLASIASMCDEIRRSDLSVSAKANYLMKFSMIYTILEG